MLWLLYQKKSKTMRADHGDLGTKSRFATKKNLRRLEDKTQLI